MLGATAGALKGDGFSEQAVDDLYTSIPDALTAASIRMGRALDLGFDLANTCRMRRETGPHAAEEAFLDLFGPQQPRVRLVYLDEVEKDDAAGEANRPRVVQLARRASNRRLLRQLTTIGRRGG